MWHCPVVWRRCDWQNSVQFAQTVTSFSPPPLSLSQLLALKTGTKLFITKSYINASACHKGVEAQPLTSPPHRIYRLLFLHSCTLPLPFRIIARAESTYTPHEPTL